MTARFNITKKRPKTKSPPLLIVSSYLLFLLKLNYPKQYVQNYNIYSPSYSLTNVHFYLTKSMEKRIYTYVIKFNMISKRHDQFKTLSTESFEKVNFWCVDFSDTQSRTLLTYNILLCWADKFSRE